MINIYHIKSKYLGMNKNNLLFLFALITICFVISIGFASANDNMTFKKELANNEFSNTIDKDVSSNVNSNIQSVSQNNSTLSNAKIDNKTSSSKEDNKTINYLIKNKEKFDEIIKKSTKKDRTFKINKYKLTISKTDYKNFLYVKFIEKYVKSGKNITLLEKIFNISRYSFMQSSGGCVIFFYFPIYSVTKKTNKIITQKIGTFKDHKTKKIYFKNYKKAKKFTKQSAYIHKIKYDKKIKKFYVKVDIPIYKNIKTKKARVYIKLEYYNGEYQLTTYTKYDNLDWHTFKRVIKSYTLYKSSKNINKLSMSKIKKEYQF